MANKKVTPGHVIETAPAEVSPETAEIYQEDMAPKAVQENIESAEAPEGADETDVETDDTAEVSPETAENSEEKISVVLVKGATFASAGMIFQNGVAVPVKASLAKKLAASGFFEMG